MKLSLLPLICMALMISSAASAAVESNTSETTTSNANILSGNWNVGGYFHFVKNSGRRDDGSEYSTAVTAKYFLIDRVALGLGLGLEAKTGDDTVANLGPAASYFFWNDGKLATYVGMGFRFGLTDATVNSVIQTSLGAEYFVAPTVAVGPALFYNHYNSKFADYQRYGVSFILDVYL